MTWQEPTINENATMKMQNYYVYTVDFSKNKSKTFKHVVVRLGDQKVTDTTFFSPRRALPANP